MSGFFIRTAEVKDAAGIAHVHVISWQETYRGLVPDGVFDTLTLERRLMHWRHSLETEDDPYHLSLVAVADDQVIGFANYGREREGDMDYLGELYAVYVLKDYHGMGIGRALVQKAAIGLHDLEISSMLVWALSTNPYRKFYERMGGVFLREKPIQIGDSILKERAYGWRDIRGLIDQGAGLFSAPFGEVGLGGMQSGTSAPDA